jgi:cyclic-di-GMP phosphodiesterase TipF (flagellum assembly factor)
MALIAASVGAVLHFSAGYSAIESGLFAIAVLFALMAHQVIAARRHDRAEVAERFDELARATANIARELGEVGRRVSAIEVAPAADLRAATEPLARDIEALGKRLEALAEPSTAREAASTPVVLEAAAKVSSGPFFGHSEDETRRLVREAVEAGRIEIYLQPVVTLPQRKVRFYEALSRLKLADGKLVEPDHFLDHARALGLLPRIDQRMLRQAVHVVRRLVAKNRDVGMFLNMAPQTLADRVAFADILSLLDVNRALSGSIVIEIAQGAFRALGPAEQESLAALAERGFRFAIDRVEDLKLDPRALAERGVRFVKVPAELMLQRSRGPGAPIHPADLANLLGRHGIDLVVVHIESEGTVVDLLDYDVRYGQGFLFAPPRPVRAEVMTSRHAAGPDDAEKILMDAVEEGAPAAIGAAPRPGPQP